jgi:hypothetical protein
MRARTPTYRARICRTTIILSGNGLQMYLYSAQKMRKIPTKIELRSYALGAQIGHNFLGILWRLQQG